MSGKTHFELEEFCKFRDFLEETAGIDLGQNKQYLVATRVRRIMQENGFNSLSELNNSIAQNYNREIRQKVIDAMTTNETFWFRDSYPFTFLSQILLPQVHKDCRQSFRIWSAACSSGQEPYSISMIIQEYIRSQYNLEELPCEIVATDLSSSMLEFARSGEFDRLSVSRGLEGDRLKSWFSEVQPGTWKVQDKIFNRVQFRLLNLLESYSLIGRFDVIFCRNVLIYFSASQKQEILRRIHHVLNKGGFLILGSSESLGEMSKLFEPINVRPGVVYNKI